MNITLAEARSYIAERHGVHVSRQTIWNWHRKGVAGNHLSVFQTPAIGRNPFRLETTRQAVDDFIGAVSPSMLSRLA